VAELLNAATARAVLGVKEDATAFDILTACRALVVKLQPQLLGNPVDVNDLEKEASSPQVSSVPVNNQMESILSEFDDDDEVLPPVKKRKKSLSNLMIM
jgi:hypothetical protein